ncbi:MAG: PEGA domain-containing protein [Ignavibacteriaceae bacterium]|nr:PEGA domain-containing protein [Ignavibacteriaceae bacterium]
MDSLIGKTVDSYKILEVLGRGGMGVVFKAIDTNLEKFVALKMIDPFLARDESFVKRFKTEAKALARLENPNIVRVYALRETEDGLFMVMEYVEAKPLSNCIQENGPFSLNEAVSISKQLLNAIGHAHKVGVIHRDIKPSNILLCNDGRVKVTDFGLAKVIKQKGPASTVTQTRAGTLYYMSPEQVKGLKNVDERSDLYSLGMTVYEMIVGRTPFEKTDSDFTIQKKIVDGEIPSPLKFDSNIPKKLTKVILKSIDKVPEKRFQKAEEMIEALNNYEKEFNPVQKTVKSVLSVTPFFKKPIFFISALAVILVFALIYSLFLSPGRSVTEKAFLSISTDPGNAEIVINDESLGYTPIEDFIVQNEGEFKLQIKKTGYANFDTLFTLEFGDSKKFDIKLIQTGTEKLTITTNPSGAMIYLDSINIGTSPIENYFINPGKIQLRVEKIGFTSLDTLINIEKNATNSLSFVLNKKAMGETGGIKIASNPSAASLWINNEFVGSTPYENSELEVGNYRILIRKKGYADYDATVKVRANKTSSINRKLTLVGKLVVSSDPSGAEIRLNDKTIGKTSYTSDQIVVGEYKIAIRKDGFKPYSGNVKIDANKTVTISEKLTPLIGKLEIVVLPFGDIYIDDELKVSGSSSPYRLELGGGLHRIKIVHPSLGTFTKSIDIVDEGTKKLNIDFSNELKLTVVSEPSFAEIFLNGESTGKYTPYLLKLTPGTYKIGLKREGYKNSEEKLYTVDPSVVEVGKGDEDRIEFTLTKN